MQFRGQELTVKELTVSQVLGLVRASDDEEPISIDLLLATPSAALVMAAATGLDQDALGQAAPSELEELLQAVKTVNPHWAGMVVKLMAAAERIRQLLPANLSEPSAS